MTAAVPATPIVRRLRRLLLTLALLAPLVVCAAVTPGPRASAATPVATVRLSTLTPAIGTTGTTIRAAGSVAATGEERLRDVEVRLRLSRTRVNSRAELAAVAAGRAPSRDGVTVVRERLPADLMPGQTAPFDLSLDPATVPTLGDFGVYVLNVEVVAGHRDGYGRVAIVRTFLPWVPKQTEVKPTGFSVLWPLVAGPSRLADGSYADESLARQLAPTGRLGRLVSAGARLSQRLPLTWVVDPELLESARDMSGGYAALDRAGRRVEGRGQAVAAQWLAQVRSATAQGTVVTLPYGDPDLVALARGGMTADLVASRDRAAKVAADLLGHPVVDDIAWPADGLVDARTLSALRGMDVGAAILDANGVPPELDLPYTPSGRADLSTGQGIMTGLLTDPGLTAILAARGDPVLGAQRFLAETAMITAELPSVGTERVIVVAPPRRWAPGQAQVDQLVDGMLGAPWLGPVSLSGLRAAAPPEIDRGPVAYPSRARRAELPPSYLAALRDLHTRIATFSSVLTDPEALVPPFDDAVFRLESSFWRGRQDRTNRLVAERSALTAKQAQVRVLPGSYTFGSKSGTIPLTIANGLPQEVIVDVRLTPRTPRLEIGDVAPVRIGPERKRQVEVPARAVANGVVIVDTSLRTPNGAAYSQPVQLRIRVTQYGTVALYITLAAAGVLFLTGILRLFRRGTRRRRERGTDQP